MPSTITIRNTALLTFTSGDTEYSLYSNTAEALLEISTAINKSIFDNCYNCRPITYVISISSGNDNDNSAPGALRITDDLGSFSFGSGVRLTPLTFGSYRILVDGIPDPAGIMHSATVDNGTVTFNLSGLGNGWNGLSIIYQATPNQYAPLVVGSVIRNTSTLYFFGAQAGSSTATIPVCEYTDVRIVKTMTPSTVARNGQITYNFLISNYGNSPATNITLTDDFAPSPVSPLISVSVNGVFTGDYTYNPVTGRFAIGADATSSAILNLGAATITRDPVTGIVSVVPATVNVTVVATLPL